MPDIPNHPDLDGKACPVWAESPLALSRRAWLQRSGSALAAVSALPALASLSACAASNAAPAAGQAGVASAGGVAASSRPWLTGGTQKISAAVRASNPFAASTATVCKLTCEATIGPCHTLSPERSDVSDGWDGLPLHMQIRVVNERCEPVAGALVEIWHTNYTGGYSGQIMPMCNNDQADLNKQFFRGYQRSDSQGVVRFDSCYPGWYRGRAVHVHFRVLQAAYDPSDAAASWLTSQLLFSDALNSEIFGQVALYKDKGQPDTALNVDGVIGKEPDKSPYLFDVQNLGGVMLASKTVVVRSNLQDSLCEVKGSMPPGPPPGGFKGPPPGFKGKWPPEPGKMPPPGSMPWPPGGFAPKPAS